MLYSKLVAITSCWRHLSRQCSIILKLLSSTLTSRTFPIFYCRPKELISESKHLGTQIAILFIPDLSSSNSSSSRPRFNVCFGDVGDVGSCGHGVDDIGFWVFDGDWGDVGVVVLDGSWSLHLMTPLGPLTNKSSKSVKRIYEKSLSVIESSSGTCHPEASRSSQAVTNRNSILKSISSQMFSGVIILA